MVAVLGIETRSEAGPPSLVAQLGAKQLLLVRDNCAHVINTAVLTLQILTGAPGVHILATSCKAIARQGGVGALVAAAQPSRIRPAFRRRGYGFPGDLTVCRACGGKPGRVRTQRRETADRFGHLPQAGWNSTRDRVCRIACRRFRSAGACCPLNDRVRLLTSGRRTALPRHRTLVATLDWGHRLLSESEQAVLRRLPSSPTTFRRTAPAGVAADAAHPESEVIDHGAELVTKSLVAADACQAKPRRRRSRPRAPTHMRSSSRVAEST